jgi:hypothetical protein
MVAKVELSRPDADKQRCVFTDASQEICAAILTQVSDEDLAKYIGRTATRAIGVYAW